MLFRSNRSRRRRMIVNREKDSSDCRASGVRGLGQRGLTEGWRAPRKLGEDGVDGVRGGRGGRRRTEGAPASLATLRPGGFSEEEEGGRGKPVPASAQLGGGHGDGKRRGSPVLCCCSLGQRERRGSENETVERTAAENLNGAAAWSLLGPRRLQQSRRGHCPGSIPAENPSGR